jgi:integrin beta 8
MLHGVVGDSIKGEQGDTVKGNKGDIGPPGPTDAPSQLIIVRHSQNTSIPSCPSGFSSLYTGYSFIFAHGFGFSQGQDLGQSGSCLREFTGIPFVTCSSGFCDSYLRDGHSYWLAVQGVNQPQSNNNVDLISRCNVCEGKATVITVHSQTLSLPNCPSKYSSIWHGFSYFLNTGVIGRGSGQDLASPGSCLEKFAAIPFAECNGVHRCRRQESNRGYWLAAVDVGHAPRIQSALGASRISKCQVCSKTE